MKILRFFTVLLLLLAIEKIFATPFQVKIIGPEETIYQYASQHCSPFDFPDNPVRAFIDNNNQVQLVFGSGENGFMQNTTGSSLNGPLVHTCTNSSITEPGTYGQLQAPPSSFNNKLWIVNTWTNDGKTIYALIHNEFHGELQSPTYCPSSQKSKICQYWNLIAANSNDGGKTYQLIHDNHGNIQTALVSPLPFKIGQTGSIPAQTNIIESNGYYYMLVDVVVPGWPAGMCLFRTNTINDPTSWRGWDGAAFTVNLSVNPYLFPDKTATTPCQPVTKPIFRFSWTYNTVIHQYLAIGIAPNFHGQGQTIVYSTSPDMLHWAPPRALLQISWMNSNPNQTGIGYPSLLDPSSAGRNFVYSGAHPYLYYTRFNPRSPEFNRRNRDLVRVPLAVTYKAVDY
ncbi:MAG: hypothetical protein A3E87_07410 [Gammaproteobacteria bacterium RIFCSPHIGHO2_12_FULL_35_23]|nr:MAG: hypothetical protein A3E87_07410 [Gammaproteobacteria bacterium RIFCSPHIGHO2_12_FULL_35_23]